MEFIKLLFRPRSEWGISPARPVNTGRTRQREGRLCYSALAYQNGDLPDHLGAGGEGPTGGRLPAPQTVWPQCGGGGTTVPTQSCASEEKDDAFQRRKPASDDHGLCDSSRH